MKLVKISHEDNLKDLKKREENMMQKIMQKFEMKEKELQKREEEVNQR